jgi:hypothetical protein
MTGDGSPAEAKIFSLACVSRAAPRPIQCLTQWVPGGGVIPWGKAQPGVTLTTHPHLVPRSRSRSYNYSPIYYLHCRSGTDLFFCLLNKSMGHRYFEKLSINSCPFMEHKRTLPNSKELDNGPYPEPGERSSHSLTRYSQGPF